MSEELKAYITYSVEDWERADLVVFAKNASQAKSYALNHIDVWEDDYTSIRAKRVPALDKMAQGRKFMDWNNPEDRIALVDLGWTCVDPDQDECLQCPAKEECDYYLDVLAESEEE